MFQRTVPLYATESFIKRVLNRGSSSESHALVGHIRILTVVQETSMKERLMRGNLFTCKLFPPHEPLSHARSSPTVRIRIMSIEYDRPRFFAIQLIRVLGSFPL